jgi:hypothetical protein
VLYFPDTVLNITLNSISSDFTSNSAFEIKQNYPNPFSDYTNIEMNIANAENYLINVCDITGRNLIQEPYYLTTGVHKFEFETARPGSYMLSVYSSQDYGHINMIKVENNNSDQTRLSYLGEIPVNIVKSKDAAYFSFSAGENLVYTAYTSSYGEVYTDQITDCVLTSTDYLFEIDNASPEQPGNIIGNSEICEDSNGIVFETNIINGVNYIWTFPSDWEIESGANTNAVTVHSGNENGLVTVNDKDRVLLHNIFLCFISLPFPTRCEQRERMENKLT